MTENKGLTDLSLLYPSGKEWDGEMSLSASAVEALEADTLFELRSARLSDFLSNDRETVLYRQETVRDVTKCPEAVATLKKCVPILQDIASLRKLGSSSEGTTDSYLYSITEVELYLSLLEILGEELLPLKEKFEGAAFKAFAERVSELYESEYYKEINKKLSAMTDRVREIKSVTVGVNLDGTLRPESAGVLSINNEKFSSGKTLEKILRLDFDKSETSCIAPLIPFNKTMSDNEQSAMAIAMNGAISHVFKSNMKAWKKAVCSYVLENTDFLLRLLPEIEFVTKAQSLIDRLEKRGLTLTYPVISNSDNPVFRAKGLTNPVIALKTEGEMVPNDLEFDENAGIYIITGPNRGGKSVITCAAGLAAVMCALGLPVCAEELEMTLCDNVFCHFPAGSDETVNMGRLGEECARLSEIFSFVTKDSLVLLDESLSSTGSYEASYIASEVLQGFSIVGCRALFSTHLHDLASRLDEINASCKNAGGVPVDSLVADITEGERSFKVRRASPDGKSYAADIANKYGLSLSDIQKKIQTK
ncbi:MAG: hypothetical protein E7660_05325 [Ruminococcaceae bacterium]|nr:hypothetical protein [Oscillospiraceae bacterium]